MRHAETAWNRGRRWQGHEDIPLTKGGLDAARGAGAELLEQVGSLRRVITSDLRRAADTADALARALGVEPVADPGWREMDVGTWSGLTLEEIRERFSADWDRLRAGEDVPRGGGETMREFSERILAAFRRARIEGETTLVVTHGGTARVLELGLRGWNFERLSEIPSVPNLGALDLVDDGSGTKFRRWSLGSPLKEPKPSVRAGSLRAT